MNDSLQNKDDDSLHLQRMLEGVTADGATRNAAADDHDTAGLRAAWLAFGQLLESANSAEFQPKKIAPSKPAPKQTRYAGTIAAAAAALCLSLCLGWFLIRDGRQVNRDVPQSANVQPSQPLPTQENPVPQPAAVASSVAAANSADKKTSVKQSPNSSSQSASKQSDWDDAIDTQITSVSQQIDAVQQTWQHRVDDVDLVQYHIDDISAGLKDDAL